MGEVKLPDTFDVGGLEIPDTTGLHDEYVSRTLFEDAGEGQVRVIKFAIQGGVLTPKIAYVSSAPSILRDSLAAIQFVKTMLGICVADEKTCLMVQLMTLPEDVPN